MKIFRIVYLLLCLIICGFVFSVSSQNGDKSAGLSEKVTDVAVQIINSNKVVINPNHNSEQYQALHIFLRKMAHFSIYASLGFCVFGFLSTLRIRLSLKILYAQIFCLLYACSDEFHQSFVSGRGPSLGDVLIDSIGAFCGIIFILLLTKIFLKIKQQKSQA